MRFFASLLLLLSVTFSASASTNVINISYTFTLSLLEQNTNNLAPVKYKIDNKALLTILATAENYAGHYPTNTFPAGAKIVWQYDFDETHGKFVVLSSTNTLVCDVSDILTAELAGTPQISYGTFAKSGYFTLNNISFDTTKIGGALELYIHGVVNETVTRSTSSTGLTTETHQFKYSAVGGNGVDPAGGLIATGTISASGARKY